MPCARSDTLFPHEELQSHTGIQSRNIRRLFLFPLLTSLERDSREMT
jgi:hypothetical protein